MNGHQPSNRLKYAVILALGFSVAQFAGAVGLGPIIGVSSHIGQPLSATIRIDGLSKEQAQRASISLASAEEYRTRGIQRLPSHDQLRFKIVPAGNGYRIQVTSKNGIREPFINFLLTVTSEGQKVTREYALFLNPDPTGNIAPTVAVPAESDNALANEPVAAKPVAKTAATVAQAAPVLPAVSAPPAQDNGFIGQARPSQGQQHGIIPASPEAEGWGAISPGAQRVVLSAQAPADAPREQVSAAASYSGATYGPVKSGETLYSIAAATKPASMTVNEMMVAIKRANPRAFSSSSMNSLMAGVTLTIPGGSGAASAPAVANAADTVAAVQETPAEKPRNNRRNRRQQQQAAATAAAPTQAATEMLAGNEAPTADVAASTQSSATEMPQDGMPQATVGSETAVTEPMAAQTEAQVAAENTQAVSGMDTGLSLEGMDSIADSGSQATSAMTDMPPVGDTAAETVADSANAVAEAAVEAVAEPVATEVAAAVQEAQAATPQTAPVTQTASAPVATPAPASGTDEFLPFGLKIWHLAAAAGVLLIGLLLAILMKARGRKRDIDDIEDMSPAEIDRMVAELEKDESLQQSFRDDLDNLDDLSYETLSQEKQNMDSSEEDLLKARLAELAELEALENQAEDDFDALAQKAQNLPAFELGAEKALAHENEDFDFDDDFSREDSADVFEISRPESEEAVRATEKTESFISDWDFSEEEPTVQTSAHEEHVEDFFEVEESWTRPKSMVSEKVEIADSAPVAAVETGDSFDFSLDDKPSKPAPQVRIVPVENPAPVAAPAEETVSPEKIEAMEINLDLATSFIATGNAQRARVWLDEVMLEGSAAQKALAAQLLKKIEAQK